MPLISLLIYIIIIGLVFYLIEWLLGQVAWPQPVRVVVRVIMALVLVLVLLQALGIVEYPIALPRLVK